jgi:hypothetical protein
MNMSMEAHKFHTKCSLLITAEVIMFDEIFKHIYHMTSLLKTEQEIFITTNIVNTNIQNVRKSLIHN